MPDTWGLMYLQFFVYCSITKSQAQYKYSTWHLGANGYLIKFCSKDSFLFLSPGLLMLKLDLPSRVMPTDFKKGSSPGLTKVTNRPLGATRMNAMAERKEGIYLKFIPHHFDQASFTVTASVKPV